MRRVLNFSIGLLICLALASCQRWVGIPSTELVKRLGPPVNIVPSGDLSIYTYLDGLGGAPMKFYVDPDGIVRKWEATPVSGELSDDVTSAVIPGI